MTALPHSTAPKLATTATQGRMTTLIRSRLPPRQEPVRQPRSALPPPRLLPTRSMTSTFWERPCRHRHQHRRETTTCLIRFPAARVVRPVVVTVGLTHSRLPRHQPHRPVLVGLTRSRRCREEVQLAEPDSPIWATELRAWEWEPAAAFKPPRNHSSSNPTRSRKRGRPPGLTGRTPTWKASCPSTRSPSWVAATLHPPRTRVHKVVPMRQPSGP